MFIKKNQPYICSICITDKTGTKVSNDTPYIIILNTEKKTYYNGLFFDDSETRLQMRYSQNGVYIYEFTPESSGTYEIRCVSENYGISNNVILETYDSEEVPGYDWKLRETFLISQPNVIGCEYRCCIQRDLDDRYWSGSQWQDLKVTLPMYLSDNDAMWYFEFKPFDECKYTIVLQSDEANYIYSLNVSESLKEKGVPVMANSSSIRFSDGTDTVVITKRGEPIPGASVSAYDKNTKKLISKTSTSRDGKWNMMIPHGSYIFMFSKDGFSTMSLERSI